MLTRQHILQTLAGNKYNLEKEFGVNRIGLFGSFATGNNNLDSDVDIIVSFRDGLSGIYEKKSALQQYLSNSFNRDVDICTEKIHKALLQGANFKANDLCLKKMKQICWQF